MANSLVITFTIMFPLLRDVMCAFVVIAEAEGEYTCSQLDAHKKYVADLANRSIEQDVIAPICPN
jgi:hypothetical protein